MDEYRKEQKALCQDGSRNKRGKYGCSCCREIRNPNSFKKWSRKQAKFNLRQKDLKTFKQEIEEKD